MRALCTYQQASWHKIKINVINKLSPHKSCISIQIYKCSNQHIKTPAFIQTCLYPLSHYHSQQNFHHLLPKPLQKQPSISLFNPFSNNIWIEYMWPQVFFWGEDVQGVLCPQTLTTSRAVIVLYLSWGTVNSTHFFGIMNSVQEYQDRKYQQVKISTLN